jgi:cell division protein FtsI (penicillin-binding protein 3)
MQQDKKDILWRIYLIYFVVLAFGVAIISKATYISLVEGEYWKNKASNLTTQVKSIDAVRGNIYASDESLLATSVPIYEVRMDVNADALTDEIFNQNIDSLAICLADLFKDKSSKDYKRDLIKARQSNARYYLIKRNVKYTELKKMRQFPIFRLGKYKGGFIFIQQNKRQLPFRQLAYRTIGYDVEGVNPVGLEGAYRNELKGVEGKRLMQKIAGGVWMPINDENEIEPEDGCDIYTTMDINIQDVAQHALLEQLTKHNARHGCVVLMEVRTGDVKAIANLTKDTDGKYREKYNYAIGSSTEPGSTFKLASLIAAMEDGFVSPKDSIDTKNGTYRFYDRIMKDSHEGGYGKITVERSFEVSSNVAISRIINEHYAKNPSAFIERLKKMNLHEPLGIEISGEGKPMIKNTSDKSWSGVSLPWMSIGYELRMTPMQILAFYNAIANDGVLVKPRFVSEIRKRGKVVKTIPVQVINESICSKSTIEKAKKMLEGVVENGTARNLKNENFKIAGKTGTAQIANDKYGYKSEAKVSHQASFVGYFPADNPQYSCIVVVNAPSNNVFYGNLVAGPIFKEIADKIYSNKIDLHREINGIASLNDSKSAPASKNGNQQDLITVCSELNIPFKSSNRDVDWVITTAASNQIEIQPRKINKNLVPNVIGMDVKDAIFILENAGFVVKINGKGAVKNQSIAPGLNIKKGEEIIIQLA